VIQETSITFREEGNYEAALNTAIVQKTEPFGERTVASKIKLETTPMAGKVRKAFR